jgi:hypothetical protein
MRAITVGRFDEARAADAESAEIGREFGDRSGSWPRPRSSGHSPPAGRMAELEAPLRALADAHPGMVGLRCAPRRAARPGRPAGGGAGRAGAPHRSRASTACRGTTPMSSCWPCSRRSPRTWGRGSRRGRSTSGSSICGAVGRLARGPPRCGPSSARLGRVAAALGDVDRALAHLARGPASRVSGLGILPTSRARRRSTRPRCSPPAGSRGRRARGRLAGEARILAEDLGMDGVAREAARLTGDSGRGDGGSRAPAAAPADPGTGTLRREGDVWTLSLGDHLVRVKDAKGLHHLALLLSHPGWPSMPWTSLRPARAGRPQAGGRGRGLRGRGRPVDPGGGRGRRRRSARCRGQGRLSPPPRGASARTSRRRRSFNDPRAGGPGPRGVRVHRPGAGGSGRSRRSRPAGELRRRAGARQRHARPPQDSGARGGARRGLRPPAGPHDPHRNVLRLRADPDPEGVETCCDCSGQRGIGE